MLPCQELKSRFLIKHFNPAHWSALFIQLNNGPYHKGKGADGTFKGKDKSWFSQRLFQKFPEGISQKLCQES